MFQAMVEAISKLATTWDFIMTMLVGFVVQANRSVEGRIGCDAGIRVQYSLT